MVPVEIICKNDEVPVLYPGSRVKETDRLPVLAGHGAITLFYVQFPIFIG